MSVRTAGETRGGFVLLEAVVALAIIGLVAIGFLQTRSQQIRVTTQARELLTAQALAEDRLAALRLLDYADLDRPPDSLVAGVFSPPFEDFSWTAVVELMDEEYDLFGLEVVVSGPSERFPLATLVHRGRALLGAGGAGEGGFGGAMGGRGGGDRGGSGDARGAGRGGEGRGGGDAGRGGRGGGGAGRGGGGGGLP